MKLVTNKFTFMSGEACSGNLESWEQSQHSLIETGKPRKTCVEVEKPVSRWENLCRGGKTCVEVEKPADNVNILKPSGYYTYHKV
jgi:hypothetical protein